MQVEMQLLSVISRVWFAQQMYGWKYAPNITTYAFPYVYAKALLFAVSQNNLCTPERQHVTALVEVTSDDRELRQFVENYQFEGNIKVASFISGSTLVSPALARVIVYEAVTAAAADGLYVDKEKDNVAQVAKQLGVPKAVVAHIEELCMRERKVTAKKKQLLCAN